MRKAPSPPPDIAEPVRVDSSASLQWDEEADVVIVGYGGAGACAAIEARDRGADVLLIDRFDAGGATRWSGGVCYAAGTTHQRAAGFDDDAEEMYRYLRLEVGDAVSDATLQRFCAESNANLQWLERQGIPFSGDAFLEKTAMPPEGKFLYYSGNEKTARYAAEARPAPRGHRTVGKGIWTGYVFFAALDRAARSRGVRVTEHAPVTALVLDTGGRVLGVQINPLPPSMHAKHRAFASRVSPIAPFTNARSDRAIVDCAAFESQSTQRRLVRARRGVVLATGGFEYNVAMLRQHLPRTASYYRALMRSGAIGSSGAGIRLGQGAGAATRFIDRQLVSSFVAPPDALLRGLVVNREGERFINEDTYAGFLGGAVDEQTDSAAWLVLDRETFWNTVRECLTPRGDGQFMTFKVPQLLNILFGGTRRGRTLAALARACGIASGALEQSVQAHNARVDAGTPDPLGKNARYMHALREGPFYALNKANSNLFCFGFFMTLGGLHVNEDTGAVLRADGSAIEGLYAAGRTAAGICSRTYLSGLSLADLVFSGRRAARALTPAPNEPGIAPNAHAGT